MSKLTSEERRILYEWEPTVDPIWKDWILGAAGTILFWLVLGGLWVIAVAWGS